MKKFFSSTLVIAAVAALSVTSCVKNNTTKSFTSDDVKQYITTTEYSVPVKPGYGSIVTCCGDTLSIADDSKNDTILIPKNKTVTSQVLTGNESPASAATKAVTDGDGVVISYYPLDATGYSSIFKSNMKQLWTTEGFEDSKNCDFDYNDLVIHTLYRISSGKLKIGIHPIAYGATKTITLGLIVYKNNVKVYDEVISTNCRHDLFEDYPGTSGFINTVQYDHHYIAFPKILTICDATSFSNLDIVWWVKTNDSSDIMYAVNARTTPNELLNSEGLPYGVVCTYMDKGYKDGVATGLVGYNWFFYPKETVSVWNYFQIKSGVFNYKDGITGPMVNDFILRTGNSATDGAATGLYTFPGNRNI
jgi:hypothetical protein